MIEIGQVYEVPTGFFNYYPSADTRSATYRIGGRLQVAELTKFGYVWVHPVGRPEVQFKMDQRLFNNLIQVL